MPGESRIISWINERLPLKSTIKYILEEDIPGKSSFFYTLGSSTLFIFLLQALTGVWQLFFYVPSTDHAYASVSFMRISVPFGWLIHGIHYWGAQAMIILVGLHLLRVFIWGAHKRPREFTWLAGVLLLILTASMSFTGVLLPWDEVGYFAAKVGTNIAGTLPLIGNSIKKFILGGPEMGQLTLSRFFIMHVAILPFILLTFIIIHLVAFRQFGSVGPWKKARSLINGPFWPDQVFKDLVVSLIILQILIILSAYIRAPFAGPADPLDSSFHPKPEWNFLFLYQALKAFRGAWEPVGTVLFPLFLILFLASVPFLDRYKENNPLKRPVILIIGIIFFAGIIILTFEGRGKVPEIDIVSPSQKKIQLSENLPANIKEGQDLFISNNCGLCHSINGAGGTVGPDLSHETARGLTIQMIEDQIRNPKNKNPQSVMPLFTDLTQEQLEALANYLLNVDKGISKVTKSELPSSQSTVVKNDIGSGQLSYNPEQLYLTARNVTGLAASIIGNPEHGRILFRQQCEGCHGVNGAGGVPNSGSTTGFIPTLNPMNEKYFSNTVGIFVNNIDTIIQHGSVPKGNPSVLRMPGFGDANSISQQQIAQIESFILSLNKVDRAMILKPGIEPKYFVWISTGAILLLTIIFSVQSFILKKRMNKRIF